MAKFSDPTLEKAAMARILANKFVCRRCGNVMKSSMRKVLDKKLTCRTCKYKAFKPKRKK